ncbi:MAG: tetratricopeptide repeat protein, partial [Steroidobacteraceae bacterium]|nr:tetratricopeptide repeat protein [Steroidobacteraceae bacterium]MDW8259063.1 tetratricopeptide repeat protein [Gammaproteobacteria bacterium]
MNRARWILTALLGGVACAKDRTPTIADLQPKAIEIRTDAKVDASAARAMDNYRKFLELRRTDPQLRAEALRRLGDLHLESGELERMEKEIALLDVQGAEAIKLYTTLLKAYPDYPRNDQVLYQLARAYETTGQTPAALATLDRLVREYPQSPQLDEVHFRRGEILFSARRYEEAQMAYEQVIATGRRSQFYSQSRYKHGWSLYKQSLNEESLPSFASVLDALLVRGDGANARLVPLERLSRANRELVDDTLRVMSITFANEEGAQGLERFLARRGAAPLYAHQMYRRLGDLYVEKQRYQDAANTYRAYVARNPLDAYSPDLAIAAIAAYRQGGFTQLVLDGEREFVDRYKFSGPFWQGRERSAFPQVVQQLKLSLKNVATWQHANAQRSKKPEDFLQAAQAYRELLDSFPAENDTPENRFLLAETLFEARQFADASVEYARTAYDYARNAKSATAGYASLVARDKHAAQLSGAARAQWHRESIDAGIRFAETFPEHPESGLVITRAAQDLFELPDLPSAILISEKVLSHPGVDPPKKRIAYTIIAQSQFELGQFAQAEQAFIRARDLLPPNDKLRSELTERLATSVYRQAEARRNAGDLAGAADDFLRVASVAPDSPIRETAEYDAASALVNLRDWNRAIGVLTAYRVRYPQSKYAREVTRNLAVAYNELGRAGEAAGEFERIGFDPSEERALQREALQTAADLYEKAGNRGKSIAMLERFVQQFPTPVPDAIEARQRLLDFALSGGDAARATFWRREIIRTDAAAGGERTDRTRTLAARAQLALAHPARDAFLAIKLTLPLKKSLDAKRKALETAMQGYRAASEYRVQEVMSAASYQIAEMYRQLAKDL